MENFLHRSPDAFDRVMARLDVAVENVAKDLCDLLGMRVERRV